PHETLLRASKAVHHMNTADRFGLVAVQPQFDFSKVMDHIRQTRRRIYDDADAPPNLEKLGAEVILGSARFCNPRTIEVQKSSGISSRLTSRFFIIATGSRPKTPNFSESTLTNETIFELESKPKQLLIIGSGQVG